MSDFWKTLPSQCHTLAKEKGWWESSRSLEEIRNNLHGEVSEAWEEFRRDGIEGLSNPTSRFSYRDGRVDAEDTPKPEGFWVEIADLVIRLADWLGSDGHEIVPNALSPRETCLQSVGDVVAFVDQLHGLVGQFAFSFYPGSAGRLASRICTHCDAAALSCGVSLQAVIELKHEYNKTRPYRHGGKHA